MVKHVIIWNLKEDFSDSEKTALKAQIKDGLEGLMGSIDGLVEIKVYTDFLCSSNGDIMLDSTFTDQDALKTYQTNPEHLKVAQIVRASVCSRKCVDFEI